MDFFIYLIWNILETLLRFIPIPCKTGWSPIGNPGPDSPVFLTCNYHLTVLRVKWTLRKMDAHLLVADSRGINVWCAAVGGHLTNHDVISVLKTSGIDHLTSHRRVILPQLAAAGIESKTIGIKTGWKIIWGPIEARDIPAFLQDGCAKSLSMGLVRFPFIRRVEMAVAWGFSLSVVFSAGLLIFWPQATIPVIALICSVSLFVFLFFPVFHGFWKSPPWRIRGFIFMTGICLVGFSLYSLMWGEWTWKFLLTWGALLVLIVFIFTVDFPGSTPVLKSEFHKEKTHRVTLDRERCQGAGFCADVCPRGCFGFDKKTRTVSLAGNDQCVRCSACIVQCPFDALAFRSPEGKIMPPEFIRKHRLSVKGKRS